jgi:hypothetical protein
MIVAGHCCKVVQRTKSGLQARPPFFNNLRMLPSWTNRKTNHFCGESLSRQFCFRDTFVADMLARGVSIYDVAQMVADTVETIEKHYAQFVPAARDAAQQKMDSGVGIAEQAKIASQRGKKVVGIRG